jgi:hypothetical protein
MKEVGGQLCMEERWRGETNGRRVIIVAKIYVKVMIMGKYTPEIEEQMKNFYQTLSEKDRRRYAAVEAQKLGYGGQKYICQILGCNAGTVKRGKEEIEQGIPTNTGRVRRVGGGRKKTITQIEGLDDVFMGIIQDHTAGSPMDEQLKWTNLGLRDISRAFKEQGYQISEHVVKQLLRKHKYVKRKMQKTKTVKETALRDEQFQNINDLKDKYMQAGNPIISLDVKKKS